MKLHEVIDQKKSLINPSNVDKKGDPLKLPNAYDNVNYGEQSKIKNKTVTVKDTHTGKVYGRRTLKGKSSGGKGLHEQHLKEGGNIFKDESGTITTQRINQTNIDPTLQWLEQVTGLPLVDNKLGTTGKRATSGDIDVAVDQSKTSKDQLVKVLSQWVQNNIEEGDPKQWIKKSGTNVHFKTPINGDPNKGFVQTDFMFGDPQWMKFALQGSAIEGSPFKGSHRHILMNSIAKANGLKWSYTKGLLSRETGNVITTDPDHIAQILLGQDADRRDLASVESILNKIKDLNNYQELIADAKQAFEKEGLNLDDAFKESTSFLNYMISETYKKPQMVDQILNMIDQMYDSEEYDKIIKQLKKNKIRTNDPKNVEHDLLSSDENTVSKLNKQVKKFVKGSDQLDDTLSEI